MTVTTKWAEVDVEEHDERQKSKDKEIDKNQKTRRQTKIKRQEDRQKSKDEKKDTNQKIKREKKP